MRKAYGRSLPGESWIALWKIAVPVIIVLFLLHCRAWHPEEAWCCARLFSTGNYQSLNAVVASVLFVIGMGGRMLYVYLCCGRDEKKGARRLGRNMLYGLFWGAGLSALCTNVVVVSLFWLNACFTSADKTCDYRIIAAKVHDRRPKSRSSRYSASWLLNTFRMANCLWKETGTHVSMCRPAWHGSLKVRNVFT